MVRFTQSTFLISLREVVGDHMTLSPPKRPSVVKSKKIYALLFCLFIVISLSIILKACVGIETKWFSIRCFIMQDTPFKYFHCECFDANASNGFQFDVYPREPYFKYWAYMNDKPIFCNNDWSLFRIMALTFVAIVVALMASSWYGKQKGLFTKRKKSVS